MLKLTGQIEEADPRADLQDRVPCVNLGPGKPARSVPSLQRSSSVVCGCFGPAGARSPNDAASGGVVQPAMQFGSDIVKFPRRLRDDALTRHQVANFDAAPAVRLTWQASRRKGRPR